MGGGEYSMIHEWSMIWKQSLNYVNIGLYVYIVCCRQNIVNLTIQITVIILKP